MSINAYTGIQGSGKTFEVVSQVIVSAVAAGRRVVTNIDGIDSEAIRAYVAKKRGIPLESCGSVVTVSNDRVTQSNFFPVSLEAEGDGVSFVRAGDLVAIDEAYRFWGTGQKLSKEHEIFFREHRHFVHAQSGIACDLVLMTQDISDLNRSLKVVIQLTFRCHKAKGVGRSDLYTVSMWEGYKTSPKTIVKDWTRFYDAEIFPLYKSYAGVGGKEIAADGRHNIFADKKAVFKYGLYIAICAAALWNLYRMYKEKTAPPKASPSQSSAPAQPVAGAPKASSQPSVSSEWRIAGSIVVDGKRSILLVSDGGRMRIEDAVFFIGAGLTESGSVDGQKVTRFSGRPIEAGGAKGVFK